MKKIAWLLLAAVVLMNNPGPAEALGCPNGPDHWFNAAINIDPKSLPAGITVETVATDYGIRTVYLTNATAIPLIINPPSDLTDATTIAQPNPRNMDGGAYPRPLILKLVSARGYFCDGHRPLRCDMDIRTNKKNAVLDTPQINRAINSGWVRQDGRPAAIEISPSRNFEFFVLYGNRKIRIAGSVTFSLNRNYNSKLGEQTKQMCAKAMH